VPYPVWRMTSTLDSTRTPERARFRMILVDRNTGQVLEGAEIHFPGSVTKTVVAQEKPLYMVIDAANVERFMITLEAPSDVGA
jgi:D-alanyl-D-alanine carboxypeptidase